MSSPRAQEVWPLQHAVCVYPFPWTQMDSVNGLQNSTMQSIPSEPNNIWHRYFSKGMFICNAQTCNMHTIHIHSTTETYAYRDTRLSLHTRISYAKAYPAIPPFCRMRATVTKHLSSHYPTSAAKELFTADVQYLWAGGGGYIELSLLIYRYFMKSFHNLASGEWSCVYIRPLKAFNLMRTLEPLRHTSIRRWQRLNACWRTDGNSEKCSFPRALRHLSTLWATASLILSKIKCGTSYLSDLSQRNHKKLLLNWIWYKNMRLGN